MKKCLILWLALMVMALSASCSDAPGNAHTETPFTENTAPAPLNPGESYYAITDYYNKDGSFSELGLALEEVNSEKTLILNAGEIFIMGDRQYIVISESLALSFYTQSSLAGVIQWWDDYVKIWEGGGVISVYTGENSHPPASNNGSGNGNTPAATTRNNDSAGTSNTNTTAYPSNTVANNDNLAPISAFGNVGPRGNTYDDQKNGVYVAPTGNDATATGTIDRPYKSINAALSAVKPGDTIILRGGTYREGINVRVRTPDITIRSAKGEWAVIDLTSPNPGADEDSGVYFDVDASGCKMQCVEVKGGFYAVCMETKWDWGDPVDRSGASNIIIEDCVLHDSKYDVVKVKPNCNNVTIRYCEIYNSGQAFDGQPHNGEQNAEGIDCVNGDKLVVQNNYIHHICSNAVYAKGGATDALIENNRIEEAYGGGILVGFDTSPEFFDIAVNPKYYENIRGIVRNNLIIGTGWEGIGFYGSKDAEVYNNTLVNVCNSGQYHGAIYFGLTYQDWESYAGRPASVNPNIHHNIICQPAEFIRPMIEIRYANELRGLSALDGEPVMSNNCYYIAGKSAVFTDRRPDSILESADIVAWQSHIGGDSGSIEADPGLDANYLPTNQQCAGMGIF